MTIRNMESDIKKIELETHSVKPIRTKHKKKAGKIVLISISLILITVGLFIGIIFINLLPLKDVIAQVKVVMNSARQVADGFKQQDLEKAKTGIAATKKDFTLIKEKYSKVVWMGNIPILGNYIKDGTHAINAGSAGIEAVEIAISALEPNADLLGFTGGGKFVAGTADQRIQTAVKTMEALTPKLNDMAVKIDVVQKEIDQIDVKRYPEKIRSYKIRSQMSAYKELINNTAKLFVNAQPLLVNLPKILGEPDEKRYLILFQNDKELRATGGFITAYAQFRLDGGKMILEKSDDIYTLDNAKSKNFPAPREILTFHKNVYNLYLRDSNLSPDYKISMQNFEKLYDTVSGREKIDGILALDTHVLVEALKILGPIYISGREFSAEVDKRCDCPRAVYELEDYATRPVGYVRESRKDIIGYLMQLLMQQALGVSPSQYWGKLFQMMLSEINQKHILAYFHDEESQKAAENFNMAGRIMTQEETSALLKYNADESWDYLHVNNANMAGAKSNMFVSEKITKDVTVNNDGTLTTKLTIDYKNPYPGSDCGLESGGLCLNAPLRNWLRVYAPKGSKLVKSLGTQSPQDKKPQPMSSYDELDKTVFEGFLIINPLGSAKVELNYTSNYKNSAGKYNLLIQKQPGTDKQEMILILNGKNQSSFTLESDKEIIL